jgi:purine-binding chemotaxis protein CheW
MTGHALYCTFRTAGRLFGVPILDVKEVTTETTCTRIPHAPSEVRGYVNIRGHVFLALDLRKLLALPGETDVADPHLVIFKPAVGPAFGVIVDEVGDIVSAAASDTETPEPFGKESSNGDRAELVAAICRLSDELLVVLDPRRFLPIVERELSLFNR